MKRALLALGGIWLVFVTLVVIALVRLAIHGVLTLAAGLMVVFMTAVTSLFFIGAGVLIAFIVLAVRHYRKRQGSPS